MDTSKRNIKLVIEYDGSNFFGWQVQPQKRTVQEEIEKAIFRATGEKCRIFGAGRTDAGVHAFGQVANFFTKSTIPSKKFANAINSFLPDDVAIISSKQVPMYFHARKSASGKHYRYVIYNRKIFSPIYRNYSYCLSKKLNVEKMKESALNFIGVKDFSSFASNAKRKDNPIREIFDVKVKKKGYFVFIDVKGKSFLYKMVRAIAGTLVEIGLGKDIDLNNVFQKKNRKAGGPNLPPNGLYLVKVLY